MSIPKLETIGLILTHNCNLDCTYCYISRKTSVVMDIEVAKRVLTEQFEKSDNPLQILFMGGEPLMEFELIRTIVEWAMSEKRNRNYSFFASTNGTLLTDDMRRWFAAYRDMITLALSYDGLPETHNNNRSDSSGLIELDFFLKNWPGQKIQMTINSHSVKNMASGVIYLLEKGFSVNANVAYEQKNWPIAKIREYAYQLKKLGEYYLEHPDAPLIYQFQHPFDKYADEITNPSVQTKPCGAGNGYAVVDVDGKYYPCHMLSPLVSTVDFCENNKYESFAEQNFSDERCEKCLFKTDCSTCVGCNMLHRGKYHQRDKTHCLIMQVEVMISMKYELLRIAKYGHEEEDLCMIAAIEKIMNYKIPENTIG